MILHWGKKERRKRCSMDSS